MAPRLKSSIWALLMAALPRLYATALAYADGSYGYVDAGHIDWRAYLPECDNVIL